MGLIFLTHLQRRCSGWETTLKWFDPPGILLQSREVSKALKALVRRGRLGGVRAWGGGTGCGDEL